MKKYCHGATIALLSLVLPLVLLLGACGGAEPTAPEPQPTEETPPVAAVESPPPEVVPAAPPLLRQVDPEQLPSPREPLNLDPDLYEALIEVNQYTIDQLANAGAPAEVLDSLQALKGEFFINPSDFESALREVIGEQNTEDYLALILHHALQVTLPEDVPAPGDVVLAAVVDDRNLMGSPLFLPVFFEFDRYEIRSEFSEVVALNASVILDKKLTVVVEGHCDERGTTEYNLALGERRARAIFDALIDQGVPPERLRMISYGEERPC